MSRKTRKKNSSMRIALVIQDNIKLRSHLTESKKHFDNLLAVSVEVQEALEQNHNTLILAINELSNHISKEDILEKLGVDVDKIESVEGVDKLLIDKIENKKGMVN